MHTGEGHSPNVPPFHLTPEWSERSPEEVWNAVEGAVASLQGTEVMTRSDNRLHAESTSRIFRFVDDLEVYWAQGSSELLVRSPPGTHALDGATDPPVPLDPLMGRIA